MYWGRDSYPTFILGIYTVTNASFIVKAVSSHLQVTDWLKLDVTCVQEGESGHPILPLKIGGANTFCSESQLQSKGLNHEFTGYLKTNLEQS